MNEPTKTRRVELSTFFLFFFFGGGGFLSISNGIYFEFFENNREIVHKRYVWKVEKKKNEVQFNPPLHFLGQKLSVYYTCSIRNNSVKKLGKLFARLLQTEHFNTSVLYNRRWMNNKKYMLTKCIGAGNRYCIVILPSICKKIRIVVLGVRRT